MPPIDPETALDLPAPAEGGGDIDIDIEPTSPNNPAPPSRLAIEVFDATPPSEVSPPGEAPPTEHAALDPCTPPPHAISPHEDTVLASIAIVAPGDTPTLATITEEPLDGLRNGAERTGRTGIFFAPQHLADGVLDDLPPFEEPATQDSGWHYVTGRRPHRMRHFVLTRLTPVLALSAVILWSYTQLAGPRTSPITRPHENHTTTDESTGPPSPPSELTGTDDTGDTEQDPAPHGLHLANADVLEILANDTSVPRRMNAVLARDRVTILNLWATYCAPCKEELPAFRELFEQQKHIWKGRVEFIPIQIDDPIDGAAARREHAAQMPEFSHFLSDRGLPTGIKAALIADGEAPSLWSLPVTVVVRCDGTIAETFPVSFRTIEDLRPVLLAVQTALKQPCRARTPKDPDTKKVDTPGPLLPRTPCGATTCTYEEDCVERQPGLKPACIQRVQPGSWGS